MNAAYKAGKRARKAGRSTDYCPHGTVRSFEDDTPARKQAAPLVLRHWWLAGWHDADIEMGVSVIEGKTA